MKSHSLFSVRMLVTTLCGIGIAAGVVVYRAQADEWDKKTILTVDQPIQVRDTYLPAGQYVFKLLNSNSDRHIVQIFNRDQSHHRHRSSGSELPSGANRQIAIPLLGNASRQRQGVARLVLSG